MHDIVSIGECCVELSCDGPLSEAKTLYRAYSGDALNVVYMATKLGSSCGYVTRVGDDPFSENFLKEWNSNGIDTSAIPKVSGFTGLAILSILEDGQREIYNYRAGSAASTITPSDISQSYIANSKFLHVSAITQAISKSSREATLKAVQIAHDNGVQVSYDTNLRLRLWTIEDAREALEEVLPYVDVIFPSHPEETTMLTGMNSTEEVANHFLAQGVKTVAIKLGSEGAWIATKDIKCKIHAIAPLGVSDTTGAGDAFDGAFLHSTVEGSDPIEAAKLGVTCAGLKIGNRGAILSQPTKEEVLSYVGSVQIERFE
jgi:2-dehydro-3-deoxygluconokinase